MKIICAYCGKESEKRNGCVNRAISINAPLYCGMKCAGLGRRVNRSIEEKRKIKSEYDKARRQSNPDRKKEQAKEYHKRTYDPVKQREINQARMPEHIEYIRKRMQDPEYRKNKVEYDKIRLAKLKYGELWESALIINKIEDIIDDDEVRGINNLHNKSQKRKRKWLHLKKLNYLRSH